MTSHLRAAAAAAAAAVPAELLRSMQSGSRYGPRLCPVHLYIVWYICSAHACQSGPLAEAACTPSSLWPYISLLHGVLGLLTSQTRSSVVTAVVHRMQTCLT